MMDRQDIQKLLGGYATGTLTPEEQQTLFEAALSDQELFDALAREQSLRDLLNDPAARAQLLAAIDEKPLPWYRQFWRPAAVVAAAAACLAIAGVYLTRPKPHPAAPPELVAEVRQPEPAAPPQAPAVADRPAPRRATTMKKTPAEPAPQSNAIAELNAPAAPVTRSDTAVAAPPAAAPMAAPAPKDFGALGGVGGGGGGGGSAGSLSTLLDGGSKPIPLQNAQALFYAPQQLVTTGALQEQQSLSAPEQQQQRDKKEQQRTAAPLKALSTLGAVRATYLGVKYTVLRRNEAGDFVEVDPNQLHAGDSVKLQFFPNDDGFLSMWDSGAAVLQAARVERLTKFDTPVVTSDRPGRKILTVQFTRSTPQTGLIRNAVEQQSATDSREHATYVVNAKTDSVAPISTTIFLTFK
ncbi:MAG: hypothetical protein P4L56_06235 [Candidatus Sulfopaludibacter sp.]|nr:hypothetical protein [Candidatus Sulfopaludibacter sp.]